MASQWSKQITIPNILTTLRLFAIPWMAYEIYQSKGSSGLAALLFLAIWFTDVLDGWIARRYNQISDFGKLYDPFVDKIFQLTTAIMMTTVGRVPLWIPISIASKDLILLIGGAVLFTKHVVVSAEWFGKITTVLIAFYFAIMFFLPETYLYLAPYLFLPVLIMMAITLFLYVKQGWQIYQTTKEKR